MTYATRSASLPRRKPLVATSSRAATLVRSLARLEREHVALLLALSELDGASADAHDSALRAALAPLLRTDLRRTQYALGRADSGQYGACDSCGRLIAARRLELNPATTRCATCETRRR